MAAHFPAAKKLRSFFKRLRADTSGLALVEFAYSLPLLTGIGLYGAELANYATVKMRISQTALALADNASRIGENGVIQDIRITESDINDILTGSTFSDQDLNLAGNGRIILSGLRQNVSGGQWIQWQRCAGALTSHTSSYGDAGDGATGTAFPGMGPTGKEITAAANTSVMFVEIAYMYQPLFSDAWIPASPKMTAVAAFNVRDDRDIDGGNNGIYPVTGVTASTCT